VLKYHGYNLEHNFGLGKQYAKEVFYILNLWSFMFHIILDLCDEQYKKFYKIIGGRDGFFNMSYIAFYLTLHKNWEDFLKYALAEYGGN
jgi:hypothetical protein